MGKDKKENFYSNLKVSFNLIKDNKLLFALLFLTVALFLGLSLLAIAIYSVETAQHQDAVLAYLDTIQTTDPVANPMGENPLFIYEEIEAAKRSTYLLFGYLALFTLVINGLSWFIVKLMINRKGKLEFLKSYLAVFFFYGVIGSLFVYFAFKTASDFALSGKPMLALNIITWILTILLVYTYSISAGLMANSRLKEIPKKLWQNSLKPMITLPTLLIAGLLVSGASYMLYFFNEKNEFMIYLALILLFLSIAYNKVLFASQFK